MSQDLDPTIPVHPVQMPYGYRSRTEQAVVRTEVSLRAYEVYCKIWGAQEAMVTGGCRGGFHIGEIVAMLYARTFPENEWRDRFDEAVRNMRLGDG